MNSEISYEVGDVIEYQPFGGGVRRVLVKTKEADVKNGRPGFDGTLVGEDGFGVWGYDEQILRVVERGEMARAHEHIWADDDGMLYDDRTGQRLDGSGPAVLTCCRVHEAGACPPGCPDAYALSEEG